MGVREINAQRTRQHIAECALTLFLDHGYAETTIEDVARYADVGLSTLYRYFATKEDLGVAPFGPPTLMADAVRGRPADESTAVATGHAVLAILTHQAGGERAPQFRQMLLRHPRLRSRALEWLDQSHRHLTGAIAERRGLPADDPSAEASAWLAVLALQQVTAKAEAGDSRTVRQIGLDVLRTLSSIEIEAPAPPSPS